MCFRLELLSTDRATDSNLPKNPHTTSTGTHRARHRDDRRLHRADRVDVPASSMKLDMSHPGGTSGGCGGFRVAVPRGGGGGFRGKGVGRSIWRVFGG